MDTFEYKGLSVEVTVDFNTRELKYENEDGIMICYEIDRFVPDLKNKKIEVGFVKRWQGKNTNYIYQTERGEYIEKNYLPFYYVVPPGGIGDFASKSIMNGLIRRLPEFGGGGMAEPGQTVIYSMPDGAFFQPVALNEPDVTHATGEETDDGEIVVHVANGVAPFSYQLNEETPVSGTPGVSPGGVTFSDLAPGEYVIRVTDSEGNWAEQTVNVDVLEEE